MRVMITGATGFIGPKLIAALEARGDEVLVVSRDPSSASARTGARARAIAWKDVDDEVANVDAVVHLAGANVAEKRWTRERVALLKSSRVEPTTRIANAIARARKGGGGKPRVFVSASAVGIYGMRRDDAIVDESAPPGHDTLADIAEAWERAAEPARAAGARVVHPRIGVVLGKDGGVVAKMMAPFKAFVGGPLGDGSQWLSWVHWRDVVGAILFAIEHDALDGAFNVSAPEPVTMAGFARAMGEALGRPSAMKVPAFALKLAVGEGMAEMLLTGQRAVPRKLEAAGYAFEFRDLSSALAYILR